MPNRQEKVDLPISVEMESAKPTMVIPFADGAPNPTLSYSPNHTATSENVQVCSFGKCNSSATFGLGAYVDPITQVKKQFVGSNKVSVNGSQFGFSVVTDIVRATIYFDVILSGALPATTIPYVGLGVATPNGDLYQLLPETIATTPPIPATTTANKIYSGSTINVSVDIPRGYRVVIICGYTTTGTTTDTVTANLNFSGGVALY